MRHAVAICTFKRAAMLSALLRDVASQSRLPDQILIIDNDVRRSGEPVVNAFIEAYAHLAVRYLMVPEQNISLARNAALDACECDTLSFLDDDERAPVGWFDAMTGAAETFPADCVIGPVEYTYPAHAPSWSKNDYLFRTPSMTCGTVVPDGDLRTGNVLFVMEALNREEPLRFDIAFGLTGGGDVDLLCKLRRQGGRILWCERARVVEPVQDERLVFKWQFLRAMRGGQNHQRFTAAGHYGPFSRGQYAKYLMRALVQTSAAGIVAVMIGIFSRARAAPWLLRCGANFGKISGAFGMHYKEYVAWSHSKPHSTEP